MDGDDRFLERAGGDLACRFAGDIAVVRLKGRLDLDLSNSFLKFLEEDLPQKPARIVLACEEIEYMSSAGATLLIQLASEHSLRIVAPRDEVLGIIETVGIHTLLSIHETEESAIHAFLGET